MCKQSSPIPAIVIFGATACGKTDFAASVFGRDSQSGLANTCEIVNADSVQVYRESVIASARPTLEEMRQVPHHLVGIRDGTEEFSVSDFVREADAACEDIFRRGFVPVLLGGSAFFLKNFLLSLPETPKADLAVRQRLQAELQQHGEKALFERLQQCDPITATRVKMHDHYRVLRALEVYETAKKPLSSFQLSTEFLSRYSFLGLTVNRPREINYQRIEMRVEKMFADGLVSEFEALYNKGYTAETPLMKAIGYREFFELSPKAPLTVKLDDVKALIKRNTRRYAKRQETFFNIIPNNRRINLENIDEITEAIAELKKYVLQC